MPPYIIEPRIFHTVRLQNNIGIALWYPAIRDAFATISPAFQTFHLVSFTVFGPYTTVSGTGPGSSGDLIYSELIVNPAHDFYLDGLIYYANAGPRKLVAAAAGRRGSCHWHWSSHDANFSFNAYSSSLAICKVKYQADSQDVDLVLSRQDSYCDITICGWGRRTNFQLDDINNHEDRMPGDHLLSVTDEQLSEAWSEIKVEDQQPALEEEVHPS